MNEGKRNAVKTELGEIIRIATEMLVDLPDVVLVDLETMCDELEMKVHAITAIAHDSDEEYEQ